MIQTIRVDHLCRWCALEKEFYILDRICEDCWEGCTMQTKQAEQREVYIEVLGGVAHIVSAPDDVDVYIIDLDEEKAKG